LRAVPELMILIKGLMIGARTVIFTFILLFFITYICAIAFAQLAENSAAGDEIFPNVPETLLFLLLQVSMPDQSGVIYEIRESSPVVAFGFTLYTTVAFLTVMNMMVGVLVDVVTVVAAVEKEEISVKFVRQKMTEVLFDCGIDVDHNCAISKQEFDAIVNNDRALALIRDMGVDEIGLLEFSEFIFGGVDELSFVDFFGLVLQFRGNNPVTIKDVVDLRKWTLATITAVKNELIEVQYKLAEQRHGHPSPSVEDESLRQSRAYEMLPGMLPLL